MDYSQAAIDHWKRPRNWGALAGADGVGQAGEAGHEAISFWIRVRDDHIAEIAFTACGCEAAIACGSITTELARGMGLDDASHISQDTIVSALGGLPAEKRHVAGMAAEALASAIMDYVVRCVEGGGKTT